MTRNQAREQARQRLRLGDRITAALAATPIPAAVHALERRTGWRCGCAQRRAWLNRL